MSRCPHSASPSAPPSDVAASSPTPDPLPPAGNLPSPARRVAWFVGIAAAVVGLLWVGREIMVAVVDTRGNPFSRELGGVLLAALVTGFAGVAIVRTTASARSEKAVRPAGGWVLAMRQVAWVAMATLVFHVASLDPRLPPESERWLLILVTVLFLFNVVMVHRGPDATVEHRTITVQTLFDTFVLASALHVTGGIINPFASLFVFHAVLAALFLPPARARLAVAFVAFAAASLAVLDVSGLLPATCIEIDLAACLIHDPLSVSATGLAVALVTAGAGFVVNGLTARLTAERDALRESAALRAREAADLVVARDRLVEERGRLDAILDCIADAVVVADPDGHIVLHNRASAGLWPGRKEGPADDLRVCHDPSTWHELFRRLSNPKPVEQHPVLRVGERFFEATWGRVSRPNDARLLGAVMVARDVTERIREQGVREQRERMATLGRLSAALAHEINNPLSSIQLYTQHALKALAGAQPLTEHLETVQRNTEACKRIVRDLLEYARQRPPQRKPMPASGLLQLAVRTAQPLADRDNVGIAIRDEGLGLLVDVDRDQLLQILVNFMLNSIQALRDVAPDAPRRIELRAVRENPHEVALIVADTGPGISESDRAHIFSPFFTTRADGTGLGLAVAHDIAHAHGGRIELRSPPGTGAVFAVVLPAHAPHQRAMAVEP